MEIRHIAVGLDGSSNASAGLCWAADLARRSDATLQVVMSWDYPLATALPIVGVPVPTRAQMRKATLESLDDMMAELDLDGLDLDRTVADAVPEAALREASRHADLLVVGRTGQSRARRLLVGSTTGYLARHAHCPVAIINGQTTMPTRDEPHSSVTVGVDGSEQSIEAMLWALDAFPWVPRVTAAHAHRNAGWDDTSGSQLIRNHITDHAQTVLGATIEAARCRGFASNDTTGEDRIIGALLDGDPRTTLVDTMAPNQTLVLGDRGTSGLAGALLGSLTDYALYHCASSLIIVRD